MDTRKIRKLIELVKETGIGELEVKSGEESVRISCMPGTVAAPVSFQQQPQPLTEVAHHVISERKNRAAELAEEKAAKTLQGHAVKAPMVGSVYLAPTPGDPPYVSVGQHVKVGDTLCLIEAMKMFNKIEADKAGVVSARLVENGQPVEYDQSLFIIDTGE